MAFPLQQAPAGAIDKRQAFYLRCLTITIAIGPCLTKRALLLVLAGFIN